MFHYPHGGQCPSPTDRAGPRYLGMKPPLRVYISGNPAPPDPRKHLLTLLIAPTLIPPVPPTQLLPQSPGFPFTVITITPIRNHLSDQNPCYHPNHHTYTVTGLLTEVLQRPKIHNDLLIGGLSVIDIRC